jgi:hypothetical protein
MADVYRICAACGKNTPMEAQHCPHCGYDTRAGLPTRQPSALPMVVGKAAVPMLVTAGTLAARVLWKLVRDRMLSSARATLQVESPRREIQPQPPQPPAHQGRRSVRIRSTWAVGDANGVWRQGYTEHQIDFDD